MASILNALRRRGTERNPSLEQPQISDLSEMLPMSSAEKREQLTVIIEHPKTSPEERFQALKQRARIGTIEESQTDLEEAEALWKAGAVPMDKRDFEKAELYKQWARICIERGDFYKALDYYKTGSKKHEGLVLDAMDFFRKCLERKWIQKEILPDPLAFCKEALEHHPGSLRLIFARANLYYAQAQWHSAIGDFAQLSQYDVEILQGSQIPPQWVHKALAECHAQTGGVESAKMHRDLAARYERNPAALIQRSLARLSARVEAATKVYDDVHVVLQLIDDDKRLEEAWRAFQKMFRYRRIRLEETFLALIGYARVALKRNHIRFALELLEEAGLNARTVEEKAQVRKYVALSYAKLQNFEKAHFYFRKAWEFCPDQVAVEYIGFLRDRADFPTALQLCHEAAKRGAISAAKNCFLEATIWMAEQKWRHLEGVCSQYFKEKDNTYRVEMLSFAIAAYRNLQHYGQTHYRILELDRLRLPSDVDKRSEALEPLLVEAVEEAHLELLLEDLRKNKYHHDSFQQIHYLSAFLKHYDSYFPKHIAYQANALFLRGDLYLEKEQFEKALEDYEAISVVIGRSRDLFIDSERALLNMRKELATNKESFRPSSRFALLVPTAACPSILN